MAQARDWPTPAASTYGSNQGGSRGRVGPIRGSLETLAKDWNDSGQEARTQENGETSPADCGQQYLNPFFVEWLMGFPPGWDSPLWTAQAGFEQWETQLAHRLQQWRGESSGSELASMQQASGHNHG